MKHQICEEDEEAATRFPACSPRGFPVGFNLDDFLEILFELNLDGNLATEGPHRYGRTGVVYNQ